MSDMPMPKKGKFWVAERDATIKIMPEADMTRMHAKEIGQLAREMGVKTLAQQDAEATKANMRRMPTVEELPVHAPIRKTAQEAVRVGKSEPAPKPVKEKVKKAALPEGYRTISELAKEWGIEPSDARAALRNSNRTKPDYGWAFGKADLPAIKKLLGVK